MRLVVVQENPATQRIPAALWPLAFITALAVTGPWLAPQDPNAQDLLHVMAPPGARHWLGADHVGRDVLSRVLAGAPRSLGLAVACVGMATTLGVALGLIAASGNRLVRAFIMRLADLMLAFPGLLLALLLAGFLGGGVWPMLIGLKLALWPQYARMTEAVASRIWREAHVEAARMAGFGTSHILLHHVLPGVARTVMPLATLGTGSAIMSISALGFLGLGLKPPDAEWGAMINEMLPYLDEGRVQIAAPCLAIFVTVLAFTLAGRALTSRTIP
jgi:ABC-type dipeptide/oligopeptide/nickel transport system permease subunit